LSAAAKPSLAARSRLSAVELYRALRALVAEDVRPFDVQKKDGSTIIYTAKAEQYRAAASKLSRILGRRPWMHGCGVTITRGDLTSPGPLQKGLLNPCPKTTPGDVAAVDWPRRAH
jgi:hypothetical protein